jgi:pimeloyl-ACP methyl ester carboxylesterase
MARRGFRAIAIDLPGHGKSYPINWQPTRTMHDYAEFVWKFAEAVCPSDKPIICGSSIGGSMTVDIACHHSRDMRAALALEGGPYAAGEQWASYCKWLEHPHAMPGWRDVMERAACSSLYEPPPERVRELRWQHRFCGQEIATGDLQCWVNHDVRDKLENISCPILAFKGEADYWVPEEMLDSIVSGVPNGLAEKATGARMGHYPMFEEPEALADILVEFLKRRKVI